MSSTDCKANKQLQNEWCFPPLRSKVQHNWVGQIGLWYLVPSKGYKEITPPPRACEVMCSTDCKANKQLQNEWCSPPLRSKVQHNWFVIASAKQRLQRNHPPWECEVMRSTDCKAIKQLQNEWCFPPLRSKVQHNWVGQIGLRYLVPSKGYKEITPSPSVRSYVQHRLQGKQTAAKWMMLSSTPKQGATQLVCDS